jgi:hypothetical protein
MIKLKIALHFLVASVIISCSATKNIADNNLTKQEKEQGYNLLFDGQTMNGWRTYQNKKNDSWSVNNGTLHCKGSAENYGGISADLITVDQFENFDLSVDWKISPKGNSGILYMVQEDSASSYLTGPEYQIVDDKNFGEPLEDWQKTAADYAMYAAPTAEPRAVGEWNNTRILVNDNHVEHWLNGKKVVEYELYSDDWQKRKMSGKWKDTPAYGMTKKGHISFQDHGSESWFKNIKIKRL